MGGERPASKKTSSSSNLWNKLLILWRLMSILSQTETLSEASLGRQQQFINTSAISCCIQMPDLEKYYVLLYAYICGYGHECITKMKIELTLQRNDSCVLFSRGSFYKLKLITPQCLLSWHYYCSLTALTVLIDATGLTVHHNLQQSC